MEPSVVQTICIFGGAALLLFGYFIRSVGTKIDKLDEKVNALTATVAVMAATQAEHGKKLDHMMGHGERISALEGANFGTAAT
ncbi:MAG: hypothetical protein OXB92_09415 [Acidimicrobiaceae bacterium]|nr:hypothetical protein [Acidimicrobiaceae bacterium]